jgi:hypothetical protein
MLGLWDLGSKYRLAVRKVLAQAVILAKAGDQLLEFLGFRRSSALRILP